ncbi:MAG: diaminopimelate epimerase [Rhodospirillaceae bacterium]|nr:MAG: diaminopimelate epimerase [Rhodospirillaceae bacterium]
MSTRALPFIKMHGLGNDFVVLDARKTSFALSAAVVRAIADRHTGVGCDQLVILEPSHTPEADVFMSIYNADGTEAGACGNATRCVGAVLLHETGRGAAVIETRAGRLPVRREAGSLVTVDMGVPGLDWRDIPLARAADTLHLPVHLPVVGEGTVDAVGVSMGNPHAVFFVRAATTVDLAALGPPLEHDSLFPERTNVEVVEVWERERLRVRVWERGTGITRACGTGACAAVVAAVRRGLLPERRAEVVLDGGELSVSWRDDGRVIMTGPAVISFTGLLPAELAPASLEKGAS